MYLKKFIIHWSIGKTDRCRWGGAEGRSDHKNAPKTEPLKSTEHTKIYVPPVYNQLIMSVVELKLTVKLQTPFMDSILWAGYLVPELSYNVSYKFL